MLYLLVYVVLPDTPKTNLAVCWQFISRHYKEHGTVRRYRAIRKLSMFRRKTGYAKLRGKASEVMGLGPALLALWVKYMTQDDATHKKVKLCLKQSVEMENILRKHLPADGFYALPKEEAVKFKKAAFAMAQLNVQLCDQFAAEGQHKIFTVTSKMHMLLHIALLAHVIHPRLTWCFSGEDYMKRIQRLVAACCTGRPNPAGTMVRVAEFYRLAMHFAFDKIEKAAVFSAPFVS